MLDPQLMAEVEAAIQEMERTYERVQEHVRAADNQAAFEAASEFAAKLRKLSDKATRMRVESVGRIWEAERLSLSALGDKIGLSKSRADALIREVNKLKQGGAGDGDE